MMIASSLIRTGSLTMRPSPSSGLGCIPRWRAKKFHWLKRLDAFSRRHSYRLDPSRLTTMPPSTVMPLSIPLTTRRKGAKFIVAGEASAGHPFQAKPPPDSAVRIFTGAVMPSGLDSVVMQEDVRVEQIGNERWVHIPPGLKQGANRRLAGEELRARRRAG